MLELINPPDLPKPQSYHQVAVATGSRWVFVSGQVSEDVDGNLVGAEDFALQARTAFANVGRALAAAGGRPGPGGPVTIHRPGPPPGRLPLVSEGRVAVVGDHPAP